MKAEEFKQFRIGNLIGEHENASEGFIHKIERIDCYCIPAEIVFSNGDTSSNPFPIKLTEEWLKKFGFESHSPGMFRIKIHNDQARFLQTMLPSKDFWDMEILIEHRYEDDDTEVWIRAVHFVHQLQNLYFALTGQELTLSPPQR